jgi:hypothetical protein
VDQQRLTISQVFNQRAERFGELGLLFRSACRIQRTVVKFGFEVPVCDQIKILGRADF